MNLACTLTAALAATLLPVALPPAALGRVQALDFQEVVRDAKARVFPAVVYIRCVRKNLEEGEQSSQQVSGSGVIISPHGEVLTNWHVIDNAVSVRCLLSDGRRLDAEVVGTDKDTDLGLLQLKVGGGETFPFAALDFSSDPTEGDFVMAMGAPFGLSRSVSIGIISCRRRYLPDISEYSLWLQTDAAINPGNSGGPLVNTRGQVIGLNTRGIDQAEDMGFAIPAETIHAVLPQLREHGQVDWSWTGLQLQPLQDFERDIYFPGTAGVIVAATDPESPARRAGLREQDRLLSVNGELLTALTAEDLPGVRRRLGLLPKHEPATFEFEREGATITVELTPREKGVVEGEELACERWDFTAKTINQFDTPQLYFHRKEGVFVYGMKFPGNAAAAGLRPQDIILKIDGQPIRTLEDVQSMHHQALDNLQQRHRQVFVVLREGLMRQLVLDYSRQYDRQ